MSGPPNPPTWAFRCHQCGNQQRFWEEKAANLWKEIHSKYMHHTDTTVQPIAKPGWSE